MVVQPSCNTLAVVRVVADLTLEALRSLRPHPLLDELAAGPDDPDPLREGGRLRQRYPADLVAAALTLHALRVRARAKFRLADRLWLTRAGLEQASSDRAAALHARRYAGLGRVADLCCGIGGDLMAVAREHPVLAVDADPAHAWAAELNAAVAGADAVEVVRGDVLTADLDGVEGVFVDPARRTQRGRLRNGSSLPALDGCAGLAQQVPAVGVKTAPGLPLELVPPGWEAEFVSEGRELKEALLWSPALASGGRRASVLDGAQVHTLVPGDEDRPGLGQPGGFLIDPDPAVTRAGAVAALAGRLGARQLDERVAFLTTDEPVTTPFGRVLAVEASLPWNLKALRAELRRRDAGAVQIRKRGSAVDVDDLRRRLRLDGHRHLTVVLTRLADRPWALVCSD
jgi:hypothetical protein